MAPLNATVCSGNPHKLAEFRALFPDWDLELLAGAEFPPEDGATYADNARIKARFGRAVGAGRSLDARRRLGDRGRGARRRRRAW